MWTLQLKILGVTLVRRSWGTTTGNCAGSDLIKIVTQALMRGD